MTDKMPMQPIKKDEHGTVRFVPNGIVVWILSQSLENMNTIALKEFTDEEREQFAQLIGYSLDGYADLSYVSEEAYDTARGIYENEEPELVARNEHLREVLDGVRKGLKEIVPLLFKIHPDDLEA